MPMFVGTRLHRLRRAAEGAPGGRGPGMLSGLRQKRPGTPLRRLLLYGFIRRLAHVLFRLVHRVRVYGHARIPASGPLLLVCNHQSNLDPPAVGSSVAVRHLEFMAKEELFS